MAINREAVAEQIFSGFATAATQLITPDVMGYNPNIPVWPYDPEQARALIQEAGADGVPIDLPLRIVGRIDMYANATKAMEDVQLWLAEIGLTATLDMLENSLWRELNLTQPIPKDRRAIFQSSHGNEAGDSIFTMLGYYYSSARKASFPDPTMDELISAAAPLTGEARQQAFANAFAYQHDAIVQDCPLVHLQAVWGLSERIEWMPRFDGLILLNTASIRD
jgi:peptide/nickel transport system substrate-binding protein